MASPVSLKIKPKQELLSLNDLSVSLENIELEKLDKTQYFEVAQGEIVLGYIHQQELKNFLDEHPEEYAELFVRKSEQETWLPATQQAFLQRRKPTLVKNNEISATERFFYLKEGQKIGPFSMDDLKAKIEKKEILVTEMIIPEKGGHWFKLFELNCFDRRLPPQSPEHLPQRPEDHIFALSQSKKAKDRFEEKDAMASLAYIGQIKSGKISDKNDQAPSESVSEFDEDTAVRMIKRQAIYKRIMMTGLVLFSAMALGWYYMFKMNNTTQADAGKSSTNLEASVPMNAPVLTPLNVFSNEQIQARRPSQIKRAPASNLLRPLSKRPTPTSIRDSNSFKAQRDELLNYDQGQNPVESDPVRSQLSPETLNPQPVEETEGQNWASPENIQQNNPGENPFDAEVTN